MEEKSRRLFERAAKVIPGGVNSPVRAFSGVGGTPPFIASAEGAYVEDVDGNRYVDYVGSWGPMLFGHADPDVVRAVQETAAGSTSFGAPTEGEIELAELICELIPSIACVRLVNSGTEATMSAVRLARGYTGREKIIKFAGNYHGHADFFLIAAGSGATTFGTPDSPGVTRGTAQDTLVASYNDLSSVEELVRANAGEIACIIVEPVAGNMGCVLPHDGFLSGLRRLCDEEEMLLIFDEVMTGFRVAPGGAQEKYDVTPDLTTLGKVIGGGLPVGAYGGRDEIMREVAPAGPVYQAGTLSGNPLAVQAGLATLRQIRDDGSEIYSKLETFGAALEEGMRSNLREAGVEGQITRAGAMGGLFFADHPVTDYESATRANDDVFRRYFRGMIEEGCYFAPSAFEAFFFSTRHGEEELEHTLSAQRRVLARL